MSEELKPCPFCGNKARVYFDHLGPKPFYDFRYCRNFQIRCGGDPKETRKEPCYVYKSGRTREEAIQAWNTRHAPTPMLKGDPNCPHIWNVYSFHRHCFKCGRQESLYPNPAEKILCEPPTPEVGEQEKNLDVVIPDLSDIHGLRDKIKSFIRSLLAAKTGGDQGLRGKNG